MNNRIVLIGLAAVAAAALVVIGIVLLAGRGTGAQVSPSSAQAQNQQNAASAKAGGLDASFGGDGKVVTNLTPRRADRRGPGGNDWASALAIQANGKIVLAGDGVVRYSSDGTLDTSFSGDGKVISFSGDGKLMSTNFLATGVAIQADGKIVVVGSGSGPHSAYPQFALARWNSDGTLDESFGVNGKVLTDVASGGENATGVAIQADGRIVVVGGAESGFALTRYDSDGTLDASFGVNGKVETDFTPRGDGATGVAIQADGGIVVVGGAAVPGRFALARYNNDGTLDASFDGDGKVMTVFTSGSDSATGVAIQADGRIVAAGVAGDYSRNSRFALARYNSDGTLDASFGVNGKVETDFTRRGDWAVGVAVQADGGIVAAGTANQGADRFEMKVALARYLGQ